MTQKCQGNETKRVIFPSKKGPDICPALLNDCLVDKLTLMAAVTVAFGGKGTLAVVTDTAEFAGIDLFHCDSNSTLLHFRKSVLVVTLLALDPGFGVYLAREGDLTHAALSEFQLLAGRNR